MSRNQFRILVVLNQLLVLTWVVVQEMSDLSLPPELGSVRESDASVMNPSTSLIASAGDIHYWFGNAILVIGLTASVGLFLGHRWGRTMFLFTWVATLFFSLAADIYVSTAWVVFFLTSRVQRTARSLASPTFLT